VDGALPGLVPADGRFDCLGSNLDPVSAGVGVPFEVLLAFGSGFRRRSDIYYRNASSPLPGMGLDKRRYGKKEVTE
jgi:hypothetical protein